MGIIEATTSSLGEELDRLFGFVSTRTTVQVNPEIQLQSGINSMNTNGNVTCTLTSGTFLLTVANGHRLRILSGVSAGAEALILTRDSGTQITLQAPLPFAGALAGVSWEIVDDADTVIQVENALNFPSPSGRIVLDGIVYFYSGRTANTFTGITHDDDTGLIVSGVRQAHPPLTVVADFSKVKSALDEYRRSFLVEYAGGRDLDIEGNNISVARPPELDDDDLYRRLIEALAYAPRGTIYAMEQVLDVLLGETLIDSGTDNARGAGDPYLVDIASGSFALNIEGMRFRVTSGYLAGRTVTIAERVTAQQIRLDLPMEESFFLESWEITDPNYEIFEDLTLGSINNTCTVFFRRTDDNEEQSAGKTFLDGELYRPLDTTSTILLPAAGRLRVAGVKLKDEGGWQEIARGTTNASSTDDGATITGPANTFPARIAAGDYFQILDGALAGRYGRIVSRVSGTQLSLGALVGIANFSQTSTGIIGADFAGVSWRVMREKTNCMHYRPSADTRIEHPADAGTVMWNYVGTNELTRTAVGSEASYGQRLLLDPNNERVIYRHPARVTPEADAEVEIMLDIGTTNVSSSATGARQCALLLSDGERTMAWGVIADAGGTFDRVGFIDVVTGSFIGSTPATKAVWSDVAATKFTPGYNALKLVKTGRGLVRLYRQAWQGALATTNWQLIDEIAYADFPTTASWVAAASYAALDHEAAFGCFDINRTLQIRVRYVDWKFQNTVDFWNMRRLNQTTNTSEQLIDASNPFVVGDVDKTVRIFDFGALNAADGNPLGVWRVLSRQSTSTVTLIGETKSRGGFTHVNNRWLKLRGEPEFVWPDHRGHSVEILDGPNAGVFPIAAIVDEFTGRDIEEPVLVANETGAAALIFYSTDPTDATIGSAPGASGPRFCIAGENGGNVQVQNTLNVVAGVQGSPGLSYDAGTIRQISLLPIVLSGVRSEDTFKGTIRLANASTGEVILEIPPGETHAGIPDLVADSGSWTSAALQKIKMKSRIVLLDTAGGTPALPNGFEATDQECTWRIVPTFVADTAIDYDLVDASGDAAGTLTLRQAMPFPVGTVVAIHVSTVLSAYLHEEKELNDLVTPPDDYQMYPFYLFDGFGFVRGILDILTAAGVIPDYDRLAVDAAGHHILEG